MRAQRLLHAVYTPLTRLSSSHTRAIQVSYLHMRAQLHMRARKLHLAHSHMNSNNNKTNVFLIRLLGEPPHHPLPPSQHPPPSFTTLNARLPAHTPSCTLFRHLVRAFFVCDFCWVVRLCAWSRAHSNKSLKHTSFLVSCTEESKKRRKKRVLLYRTMPKCKAVRVC